MLYETSSCLFVFRYGGYWYGWSGSGSAKFNCDSFQDYSEDEYSSYDDDYRTYCESQEDVVNVSNITGIIAIVIIVVNIIGGVMVKRWRKFEAEADENRISISSDMGKS